MNKEIIDRKPSNKTQRKKSPKVEKTYTFEKSESRELLLDNEIKCCDDEDDSDSDDDRVDVSRQYGILKIFLY